MSSNLIIRLFGIYLVVVIVATVVYYFIPSSSFFEADIFEESERFESHQQFFEAVHEGRIDDIDESYVKDRIVIDYDLDQIHVAAGKNDDYLSAQVLVERKDVADDKIEVIQFKTPTKVEEFDLTELKEIHRINLERDTLRIIQPQPVEYNVSKFENEFVIRQFTGEQSMGMNLGSSEVIGSEVIYIRIPIDLTISGEIYQIEQ